MKAPTMTITYPCGVEVDVELNPSLEEDERNGRQYVVIDPDMSDLWAHSFTHDKEK